MAQRDIKKTLAPDQQVSIAAVGDYFFVKQAFRDFKIRVAGQTIEVTEGDYSRYKKSFSEIELINPDKDRPLTVSIVVGDGHYDRKIVRGEMTVNPGVRKADGSFVDDRRYTLPLSLMFQSGFAPESYTKKTKETISVGAGGNRAKNPTGLDNGNLLVCWSYDGVVNANTFREYDKDLNFVGEHQIYISDKGANNIKTIEAASGYDIFILGGSIEQSIYLGNKSGITEVISWDGVYEFNDVMAYDRKRNLLYVKVRKKTSGYDIGLQVIDCETYQIIQTIENKNDYWGGAINGNILGMECFGDDLFIYHDNGGSGKLARINQDNLGAIISNESGWDELYTSQGGLARIGNYWYTKWSDSQINRLIAEDFTITGRGYADYAANAGATKPRLTWDQNNLKYETQADIQWSETDTGQLITGQIIKASLELYYGLKLADDYLDHIYAIRIKTSSVTNMVPPFVETKSRGATFAAAKIADEFTIHWPCHIEIETDDSLEFQE